MAHSDKKSGLERFLETKRSAIENDPVYRQIYEAVCELVPYYTPYVNREHIALTFYLMLQNTLSWDTTCLNCSRLMDRSYEDYVRREQAEAALVKANEKLEEAGIPPVVPPLPEELDCYD